MDSLQIKAALAGVFFGLWPLFMNKSGLSGLVSPMFFALIALTCVLPFGLRRLATNPEDMLHVGWTMVILAGVFGAVGTIFFNDMLSKATPQSIGTLFVIMIVVQVSIPAIYSVVMNGSISLSKAVGFCLAAAAAVLLVRS